MRELWHYIGITPTAALAVLLSTITIYFVFGGVLRLWGQRLYASPRSLDLAVVTVLGAIVGRSTMGHVPTLAGGMIALGTLAALELTFRGLRRLPLPATLQAPTRERAVVLACAGSLRGEALERYGLTPAMLWSSLRQAGVSHLAQTALVVLEPNGRISVLRTGAPIHPRALLGVKGGHRVLAELRAAGLVAPARSGGDPDPGATPHEEDHQPHRDQHHPGQDRAER